MKTINDIRRQIQPALQKIEHFRLEKLEAIAAARKWYIIPTIIVVIAVISIFTGMIPIAIILGIIGLVGYVLVAFLKVGPHETSYIASFKEEIFKAFVQGIYPNTYYAPANYLPSNLFASSRLFGGYDSYGGEDYFEGKTDSGSLFKFSELRVTDTETYRDSDNNTQTRTTTIFDGMFFVLDVPNRVAGRVQVLPDMAESSFGFLGKFVQKNLGSFFQGAKMVYLEDHPEFEKAFVVYSQNEDEAYRILTPTLVQAIYDLRYKWNVTMRLSFIDNQIYVALSTSKNFFQPNIKKSVLEDDLLNELYDELALCFAVVEDLSEENPSSYNPKSENPNTDENNPFYTKKNGSNNNPFLM